MTPEQQVSARNQIITELQIYSRAIFGYTMVDEAWYIGNLIFNLRYGK